MQFCKDNFSHLCKFRTQVGTIFSGIFIDVTVVDSCLNGNSNEATRYQL